MRSGQPGENPLELLTCPNCGGFVNRDWDDCRTCGHELSEVVEAKSTLSSSTLSPANPEPVAPSIIDGSVVDDRESAVENSAGAEPDGAPMFEDLSSTVGGKSTNVEPEPAAAAPEPADQVPLSPDPDPVSVGSDPDPLGATVATGGSSLLPPRTIVVLIIASTIALIMLVVVVSLKVAHSNEPTTSASTTSVVAPADTWLRYTDPQKRFALKIPTPPELRTEKIDGLSSSLILSDTTDRRVRTSTRITEFAGGWSKEDKVLSDALTRYGVSTNQTNETQVITKVNDRRQLAATLKQGERRSSYRAYVQDKYLVELSVTTNDGHSDPELFTRFADSFVLPAP